MSQNVIVTDLNRCTGCLACVVACKARNDVPLGRYWQKVTRIGPTPKYEGALPPDIEMYFLPSGCQHCENPDCVAVCPTGASYKDEDGSVQIDAEACIGCQACVAACPYGVRYLNEERNFVEKCTLCQEATEQGDLPACVAQCGGRARFFGDIENGIENLEGPGDYASVGDDKDYESMRQARVTLGDYVEPFTEDDIHYLTDYGTGPSFPYILRNRAWQE